MKFQDLPAVGADLDGGTFAGITTLPDGRHVAVVLLAGRELEMKWDEAVKWARLRGAELPSRPVAALLFANLKGKLTSHWHWTSEEDAASAAWFCYFGGGGQDTSHKTYKGGAVAVRYVEVAQ